MKVILDTHCWLWWVLEPSRLGPKTLELIGSPSHQVYLSAASTWEVIVKTALGKLDLPDPVDKFVNDAYAVDGFLPLAITSDHTLCLLGLPTPHKDPFDRLLIAQAIHENALLVTDDEIVRGYPVRTWSASE